MFFTVENRIFAEQKELINLIKTVTMKKELLLMLLLALIGMTGNTVTAVAQNSEPNELVEIATVEELNTFASLVEAGVAVDGVLTADIDLTQSDYPNLMIGTESNPFNGIFD